MDAAAGQTPIDRAIAKLSTKQHGVIAIWQLWELGLSTRAVDARVEAGRLLRLYRGVFAVGHRALTSGGPLMAAVIACGPQSLLSHVDAAELHGFRRRGYVRSRIHVTAPTRAGRRYKRIVVHSGASLL